MSLLKKSPFEKFNQDGRYDEIYDISPILILMKRNSMEKFIEKKSIINLL